MAHVGRTRAVSLRGVVSWLPTVIPRVQTCCQLPGEMLSKPLIGVLKVNCGFRPGEMSEFCSMHGRRREKIMGFFDATVRAATGIVNLTTAAAGAVSGAAVRGVVGGVRGTVEGMRSGVSSGSHSTPAAALTFAALGAAGLVEWPVVLVAGGAALAVRQLSRAPESGATSGGLRAAPTKSTTSASGGSAPRSAPTAKRTTRKPANAPSRAAKSAPRAEKSAARKAAQPRRSRTSS
jgi:hypothetical protein